MAYLKYGIVTKVKIIKDNKRTNSFIKDCFNLKLYNKLEKDYLLKEKILTDNIKDFRKELIEYTKGGDSIDNCEAFCLETTADNLLESKINLCNRNERYYFDYDKSYKFDTDSAIICDEVTAIKLFMIPVFWDVNKVLFDDYIKTAIFINSLVKKTLNNVLKDASFLIVV